MPRQFEDVPGQMVDAVEELIAVLKALHFPADAPESRLLHVLESGLDSYKTDVAREI